MPIAERVDTRYNDANALSQEEAEQLIHELADWELDFNAELPKLKKCYRFADFESALGFASRVGRMADEVDHHPRMTVEWGKVKIEWWTHKVGGLHVNDFVCARNSDELF